MSEPTTTPAGLPTAPAAPAPSKRRRWPWIVGIIVAFFLGIGIGGANSTPTAPAAISASDQAALDAAAAQFRANLAAQPADAQARANIDHDQAAIDAATRAAAAGPATSFADGTFVVGGDIKAGTYKASPAGECYWARLSSTSSESDIIANHLASGPTTVTISAGDKAFVSTDCGTWAKVK